MAATTLPFLSLLDVRLTLSTSTSGTNNWIDVVSIDIDWDLKFDDRSSGASKVDQFVAGRENSTWTIKGWNSSNMSFGHGIVTPGTRILTLTLLDTSATPLSVLSSDYFTKFPPTSFMFGKMSTSLTDKPSQWTSMVQANVLG